VDGCSFAVRREIFDQVQGFAEHFSPYGAEDAHFAFKVLGSGYRVLYVPSVVVIHAFSPKGRNRIQFTMHVRNSLSIPLELFPMPHALLSWIKSGLSLLKDAREQKQVGAFAGGAFRSLSDFRSSRRRPMPMPAWRRFRDLVRDEKQLART
jgi:GT2 family glycosyltransferase